MTYAVGFFVAPDDLLKPFDRVRFAATLARVRERHGAAGHAALTERLATVLEELQRGRGYAERVLVRLDGRVRFISTDLIDWIEAADNYVRLHAGQERHLVRETIRSIESRLDPDRFIRIHRSTIVNIARVRELQPTSNGEYTLTLATGAKLTISRTYRDAVLSRLGMEG